MQRRATGTIARLDTPRAPTTVKRPHPVADPLMHDARTRIREATTADLDALLSLEDHCFGTGPYRQHRFQHAQYRYYLDNPQAIVLIALQHSEPVASLLATAGRRSRAHIGRIVSIGVVSGLRRAGIGSRLLRKGLNVLRRRGCTRVYLEVAANAGAARSLFANTGFKRTRRLPDYYGPGIDGIRMMQDF